MKNYFKKYTVAGWLLCLLFLSSCAMDQRFVLPRGPEGPAGKSAYEVWMEWIENNGDPEWEGGIEMPDWLLYLKGDKGDPGDNGELPELADLIPTIEIINNTWWINGEDTGVPATGPQGPVGPVGPIGPGGAPGLSAYQLWLELIADGNVPDPHNPEEMWDPENDSEADFWYYLKGAKGDKGETAYQLWVIDVKSEAGLDDPHKDGDEKWPTTETDMDDFYRYLMGAKGLSAYELWKADVLKLGGLDDPHKDGDEKWPATEADTQMDDFYRYLTGLNGENGLSAYELWKEDVLDNDGLAHPKFPNNPNAKWPASQVEQEDFWEYLKGLDGKDGLNGATFVIEDGKYNVHVQYTQQEYSEYVNVEDGSVTFIVYGKDGERLADAEVTMMPGINNTEPFISGEDGTFTVPREQLPVGVDEEYRFGQAFVKEADQPEGELSAANTYVPERIEVRMRLRGNVTLTNSGVVQFPMIVERRTEVGGAWQVIPNYLPGASLDQLVRFYWVNDEQDYEVRADGYWGSITLPNISNATASFTMSRPKVFSPLLEDTWETANGNLYGWDGTSTQYFVAQLESYYGVKAQLVDVDENSVARPVVSQRVPVQRIPIVAVGNPGVNMGKKNTHETSGYPQYTMLASGSFDMALVDYKYFYEPTLVKTSVGDTHLYIHPTVMEKATVDAKNLLRIQFSRTLDGAAVTVATPAANGSKLSDPTWSVNGSIFDGATVSVITTDPSLFYGVASYNQFNFARTDFNGDKLAGFGTSIREGTTHDHFTVDDIPVTFAE